MTDFTRIQLRRDSAADWTSANPVLAEGEIGLELDTNRSKQGDGVTAWTSLEYTDFWAAKALVDGATIASDWDEGSIFTVTLGGARTLSNPTNIVVGRPVYYVITSGTSTSLEFGSYFSLNGEKISNESGAVTVIKAVALSSTSIQCFMDSNVSVDFETTNLKLDVASNTTVTITADKVAFVNKGGEKIVQHNFSATADITSHIVGSEKASHDYDIHIDSAGTIKMLPKVEGTADTDTASKLVDSGATFVTDGVTVGSKVYNLTDLEQGTVTAVDSETALSLSSDFFPDGDEDYRIVTVNPAGLGDFVFNPGAAYNNGSSNLDDSTYTQIQEEKFYTESAGDFTVTGDSWAGGIATISIRQINDWTGVGIWKANYNFSGIVTSITQGSVAVSGIVFKTISGTPDAQATSARSDQTNTRSYVGEASGTIYYFFAVAVTNISMSGDVELDKKPTFHT
jgi:hypothetical protein